MADDKTAHRVEDCAECRGTGKIGAGSCHSCDATGQVIIHSHEHGHGGNTHDHPHPHTEPHFPGDDTAHDHRH